MKPCEEKLSSLELTGSGKNMIMIFFSHHKHLKKSYSLAGMVMQNSSVFESAFFPRQVPFENKIGRMGLTWFRCQPQIAAKSAFWSCCQSRAVFVTQLQFDFWKAKIIFMSFQNFVVLPSFWGIWHTFKVTLLLVLSLRSLCKLPFLRDF